jgi:general secretion pathway protein G
MKKRQSAFTLIEIMLVVAIIGVLLSVAIYKLAPALDFTKGTKTRADIGGIKAVLIAYNGSTGSYPAGDQGLRALVPRLMESVPKDSWGTEYIYRCPGRRNPNTYDLFSAGPDHIADTADDDWGNP